MPDDGDSASDRDVCSFCRRPFALGAPEEWRTEDGTVITYQPEAEPCAMVEREGVDRQFCLPCFEQRAAEMSALEQVEVLYEFGLHYLGCEQYTEAREMLHRAVALHRTADHLAMLAVANRDLNNTEAAREFYLEALALDAGHSIALNNLAILIKESGE